ncbi:unnamed protein product [Periconia digitata]|uniref:Uncharacterized protein n=1 Tax=Periconia digitata TaxID=1303443 RepID=A0A9W4URI6_9PLEO|nr:unnamed protein product [Periconia digitata]
MYSSTCIHPGVCTWMEVDDDGKGHAPTRAAAGAGSQCTGCATAPMSVSQSVSRVVKVSPCFLLAQPTVHLILIMQPVPLSAAHLVASRRAIATSKHNNNPNNKNNNNNNKPPPALPPLNSPFLPLLRSCHSCPASRQDEPTGISYCCAGVRWSRVRTTYMSPMHLNAMLTAFPPQFVQNVWIESYDPTIEDSYRKAIEVDGRHVILEILDTAGTEQFTAMRELYMKTGQGFLLVFSITSMSSLYELNELREQIRQIKESGKSAAHPSSMLHPCVLTHASTANVPMVLVGNKSDLEDDRAVSRARAFKTSQDWGGVPYYEASARRRANVDEVFVDLCRQIIMKDRSEKKRTQTSRPRPRHKPRCTIL